MTTNTESQQVCLYFMENIDYPGVFLVEMKIIKSNSKKYYWLSIDVKQKRYINLKFEALGQTLDGRPYRFLKGNQHMLVLLMDEKNKLAKLTSFNGVFEMYNILNVKDIESPQHNDLMSIIHWRTL